ncbi:MAG: hypothetical protein IBX69_04125 [Anaerolineales bacterium]|nr:hypothetical protein [Anaerolineales bacterium]
MTIPENYSFIQYLKAKKTVDDIALNFHVLKRLSKFLNSRSKENPLRILEIGSGIGTMLVRLLEKNLLYHTVYTAIDRDISNVRYTKQYLVDWDVQQDYIFEENNQHSFNLIQPGKHIQVNLEAVELMEFILRERPIHKWDLVIAHAFLDLVDSSLVIPDLLDLLEDEGLFYFTLIFDGATILEPPIQPEFDHQVITLYHQSMDFRETNGTPTGGSRSGRRIFHQLMNAGANILSAGSSDWVLYPQDGGYRADEAFFLHFIIHTIYEELKNHPQLDPQQFKIWINQRHSQIERGEMVFIAHQLDVLGTGKQKMKHLSNE